VLLLVIAGFSPERVALDRRRRINQRLASRCSDVADHVGGEAIFGMFRYVSERGKEHEEQLCPPTIGSGGLPKGNTHTHCDAEGKYSAVRGFAHALCKSELGDCDDKQRPDPEIGKIESVQIESGGSKKPTKKRQKNKRKGGL